MKATPKEKVSVVLKLLEEGLSERHIQAKTGIHRATVGRIRKIHRPELQISKGGRPKVVPKRLERAIVRSVLSTESGTAVEAHGAVQAMAETRFSVETARNILRQGGLRARVKRKKPLLTARHVKARLDSNIGTPAFLRWFPWSYRCRTYIIRCVEIQIFIWQRF